MDLNRLGVNEKSCPLPLKANDGLTADSAQLLGHGPGFCDRFVIARTLSPWAKWNCHTQCVLPHHHHHEKVSLTHYNLRGGGGLKIEG